MHEKGIRVAIVDNDVMTLRVLANLVPALFNCVLAWCAVDGSRAIDLCKNQDTQPDLLLLDVSLNDISGLDVCERIRKQGLKFPVLFITAFPIERYALEAARVGAQGIIRKDGVGVMGKAIESLLAGGTVKNIDNVNFLSPDEACSLFSQPGEDTPRDVLSPSEEKVFQYSSEGYTLTEIANEMQVAPSTVRGLARRGKLKFNAKNLSQAIIRWIRSKEQ